MDFQPGMIVLEAIETRFKLSKKILTMMLNLDPFHPTEEVHRMAEVEILDDWFSRLLPKFNLSCELSINPLLQELAA